jgi:hypothetical protein
VELALDQKGTGLVMGRHCHSDVRYLGYLLLLAETFLVTGYTCLTFNKKLASGFTFTLPALYL